MDRQKLGEVVGAGFAGTEELHAENWLPVFDDAELLAEVARRKLTVAGESGSIATANLVTGPVTVPEIDAETAERLETLSPDFRERVTTRYTERYTAVDGYIRAGKLPETYRLPELGTLVDRVIAVAPAYEAIKSEARQAEIEFVSQGLTINQWNDLLAGHKLPDGDTTNGVYRYHDVSKVTDPTNPKDADTSLWDVAVMDVSPEPKVRGISADGSKAARGYDLKKALKSLRQAHSAFGLPELDASLSDLSADEVLIKQLSPSEDMTFAIQLGRLERGEQPIDSNGTWTIGKENVKVFGWLYSVFSLFYPRDRLVRSDSGYRDYAYGNVVVRLSARGKDLSPQA
jgi:hypothetical protein